MSTLVTALLLAFGLCFQLPVVLTLLGLVVLGVAPASCAAADAYISGREGDRVRVWRTMWTSYRSQFVRANTRMLPLLVVQGANDSRVVQAESDNMVAALRERGVEVEYMVKEDEGHGFVNPDNNIDMYHAVERFLAEHLGGRP